MGMDTNTADVMKLLDDDKLVDQVVQKFIEDPEVLDDVAEAIADEIADFLL